MSNPKPLGKAFAKTLCWSHARRFGGWLVLSRLLFIAVLAVAWTPLDAAFAANAERPPAAAPAFLQKTLRLKTAGGRTLPYQVEIATTPEQQAYGLMFRRHLSRGHGMLFLFEPQRPVAFWMKNTLIPLDLLFIRGDGRIVRITENANPEDLSFLPSGEPVAAVLEINGGEAAAQSLRPGDTVALPLLDKADEGREKG